MATLAVALLVGSVPAQAQGPADYDVLHGFEVAPWNPLGTLVLGPDGALYGTTYSGGTMDAGTVFRIEADGSAFTVIHDFDGTTGFYPWGALVVGPDGALYGTTQQSATGWGVVFRINTDGTGVTVVHRFDQTDGASPIAGLVVGPDDALYGTTTQGGATNAGVVFRVKTDGTGFAVLHHFDGSDGATPYAGLAVGPDGALYGTTSAGGASGNGVVIRIEIDGSGFAKLHDFDGTGGATPWAVLAIGPDNALYGTTTAGGASGNAGVVFKIETNGSGFMTLHEFDGTDGSQPIAGMLVGPDAALYGTTSNGGARGWGTVFRINADGSGFGSLHGFDYLDGGRLYAGLVVGPDGYLYGAASQGGEFGRGVVFEMQADGSGFARLHDFRGASSSPLAGLVAGSDGSLYGTTSQGGLRGWGTVFRIEPDGSGFTTLHEFDLNDGAVPSGRLVVGPDGALYGTAQGGGAHGWGVIFRIETDGTGFTLLHEFDYATGAVPSSGLVVGLGGELYGTAMQGGANGWGVVFRIGAGGSGYVTLYDFDSTTGAAVYAALVVGPDGALYGTTQSGGANAWGIVFKIETDGSGFDVLHEFDSTNGSNPNAGLVIGPDDALYGTTFAGGANGWGVVFRIAADGSGFAKLHDFDEVGGARPWAGLVLGPDGALYGTTEIGGASGWGVIFRIATDGSSFTNMHDFDGTDGAIPRGDLVVGSDGAFYGTTFAGGPKGGGTVFRLAVVSELIANGGFEGGNCNPWVLTGNGVGCQQGAGLPHSGAGFVRLGGASNRTGKLHQDLAIPAGAPANLTFWLNVTSTETTPNLRNDRLAIEVRNTSNVLLATLALFSNLDKTAPGNYSQKTFSMAAFAGQTVRLSFRSQTNATLTTTFRVDDVSLQ